MFKIAEKICINGKVAKKVVSVTKVEGLLTVGMLGVSAGMTMLIADKWLGGLIVTAVGVGLIFVRGFIKK